MNIGAELLVSIGVNVIAVAYFAGVHTESQKSLENSLEELKEHFKERFESLEKKQDKHNNLIERMAVVEQSVKSAHHRIDDAEGGLNEYFRKRNKIN